ncbi:hypothetical protein CU044_2775 [Streptomyces sp. L-9-10]|nr:hypothetical protein CU044_2775 [Streptomyces sp. L-9-10]
MRTGLRGPLLGVRPLAAGRRRTGPRRGVRRVRLPLPHRFRGAVRRRLVRTAIGGAASGESE